MEERKSAFFTIMLLASIILVFTVTDLIQGDRTFSETEKRMLKTRPVFTWDAVFDGKYTRDYEAYLTDQFVSRDKWIRVKTCLDMLMQKAELNGVYLGKDHYLIEQHLPGDYTAIQENKKLLLLEKLVKRWDAAVMLVPTADNILRDRMPAWAPYYNEADLLDRVERQIGSEHYIDVYSILRQHAEEEIYYRTDHHWTTLGAYYGYLAWTRAMGREGDIYAKDAMELVTDQFLGTLHARVNLNMKPDSIYCFPEDPMHPVKVTYDLKDTKDSCYEESYLETRNKYGFFLDDNHALIEIETDYRNGKTLFVIKDSYANCFVPLLIPYYEKIYVMDLRYFNGRLFGFMERYEPEEGMDVLVLYNCIHFLEDFSYLE